MKRIGETTFTAFVIAYHASSNDPTLLCVFATDTTTAYVSP